VPVEAALLDVDGTLIDSNYQHALAWYRAFRRYGIVLPVWRIHRSIGMGGDQLVPALVGEELDQKHGDEIRDARKPFYKEQIDEVEPFHGAHGLIVDLRERGVGVVLASSSPKDELEHYLDLLDAHDLADAWTTEDDVESTKPAPNLVRAALKKAGTKKRRHDRRYALGRGGRWEGRRRDRVCHDRRLVGAGAPRRGSRSRLRFGR